MSKGVAQYVAFNAAWLQYSCDKLMEPHVIFLVRGWGRQPTLVWSTLLLLVITHTLVPAAPTILAVEATSSTSISVKWAACTNDGGSSIISYLAEYRPTLDPASPFETHLLGEDVFSTTLDDLTPSTEYDVRVRVENAVGRSDPSVTMQTKTKDDGELKS